MIFFVHMRLKLKRSIMGKQKKWMKWGSCWIFMQCILLLNNRVGDRNRNRLYTRLCLSATIYERITVYPITTWQIQTAYTFLRNK